tara:strand:- start:602 stop:787 length:186 start_codon:yes stop_codon:yes gene_type:complete
MTNNIEKRKELMYLSGDAMERGDFEASQEFMQEWRKVEQLMTTDEIKKEAELNFNFFLRCA